MSELNYLSFAQHLDERYESCRIGVFKSRRFSAETLHKAMDEIVSKSGGLISVEEIGKSFEGRSIRLISVGQGNTSALLWSQMHGDEPTATMAIADILNFIISHRNDEPVQVILSALHLLFIPMLNPDGAARFQRRTAQGIDMNRDALALATPEAQLLKKIQNEFKPQFGFNLHDQELSTVGTSKDLTAVALLAPAIDEGKSDNQVRLKAKRVAATFASVMNHFIPGKVARYDDTFEQRAFGDTIQQRGTSTVLVESGHWLDDPEKDFIRKLNFVGILSSLYAIATGGYQGADVSFYESLPYNGKRAYDLIIRNILIRHSDGKTTHADLGISYQVDTHTEATPKLVDLGDLQPFVGLREIDGKGKAIPHSQLVLDEKFEWRRLFPA
ncbi:MAG: peptidase M14 [Ignavibacteriae bacterium]|nr:peptidase M14 [Ignavibacteriota bacterium]